MSIFKLIVKAMTNTLTTSVLHFSHIGFFYAKRKNFFQQGRVLADF